MKIKEKEIAECIGLWLAEGDKKTKMEITFTNNCFPLIEKFHRVIKNLFTSQNSPRIYVYSKAGGLIPINISVKKRYYKDVRAGKPYYIYRLADVKMVLRWKKLVINFKNKVEFYPDILRGFFAGEGNVHFHDSEKAHKSRMVRISQKPQDIFIERVFEKLRIRYRYARRSYRIWGRDNLEKLQKLEIAKLHPDKSLKFNKMMKGYKQRHYSRGYLKREVYKILNKPFSTRELSKIFNRSFGRIQDILVKELKKENKVINYRVGSVDYWIRKDKNTAIISSKKRMILKLLHSNSMKTQELSEVLNSGSGTINERMKELEKLKLVNREEDKKWRAIPNPMKIIIKY